MVGTDTASTVVALPLFFSGLRLMSLVTMMWSLCSVLAVKTASKTMGALKATRTSR